MNLDEVDPPPPYPGLVIPTNNRRTTTYFLPRRLSVTHNQRLSIINNEYVSEENQSSTIQPRQWKTLDNQYRICYTGNLPDDFLQIKFSISSDVIHQKFSTTVQSDPSTPNKLNTSKIRAQMLQTFLTQIEQGQTLKTSMVPEEPMTQHDNYTYGIH